MLKGLSNLASLVRQAQELQGRMKDLQASLARLRVEGSAGGGMVRVEANGQQKVLGVRIEPSLFETGDREMLEELMTAATNQALEKSKQAAADEMSKLTQNIQIPGLAEAMTRLGLGGDKE